MQRVPQLALLLALFAFCGASERLYAEDDRRDQMRKAAQEAEQGNQQKLMPNMMGHIQKAMDHEKKAEEARQQQDEGKAQEEEKKAQMEQMKAQQLKQQMDKNQDSANQNRAGAEKLTKYDDPAVKGNDPNRIIVDKDRLQKLENREASNAVTPQPTPHAEIARLDNFEAQKRALDELIASSRSSEVAKAEPEKKAAAEPPQEVVSNGNSRSVSFNDFAPKGSNANSAPLTPQEAVNAGTGVAAPAAPQDRLLNAGNGSGPQDGLILSMRDAGTGPKILGPAAKKGDKEEDFFQKLDKKEKERRREAKDASRRKGVRKVTASAAASKPGKPSKAAGK